MNRIRLFFESLLDNFTIVLVPLAGAIVTGLRVGTHYAAEFGIVWGVIAGIGYGFGIEAGGYLSFKADQIEGGKGRPLVYIALGIFITVLLELPDWSWVVAFRDLMVGSSVFLVIGFAYWNHTTVHQRSTKLSLSMDDQDAMHRRGYTLVRGKLKKVESSRTVREPERELQKVHTPVRSSKGKRLTVSEIAETLSNEQMEFIRTPKNGYDKFCATFDRYDITKTTYYKIKKNESPIVQNGSH